MEYGQEGLEIGSSVPVLAFVCDFTQNIADIDYSFVE